MDSDDFGALEATALLSSVTGVPYRLSGRLSGGETGAHAVVDTRSGKRFGLKWELDEKLQMLRNEAVSLSERLRTDGGWPVPRQWIFSEQRRVLVLQQLLEGSPPRKLDMVMVDQLLALHGSRLGLARPGDPGHWPHALVETLTIGGPGYCLHETLRRYDKATARLVASIEEFGSTLGNWDPSGKDIVHWDLHPGNLLVDGRGVCGIVDTDFTVVGDAVFDLVMFALTSLTLPCDPGVRKKLFEKAFDDLDDLRRRAYLGHLFVRIIDWPIRRGRKDEIDFWLKQADRLLDL